MKMHHVLMGTQPNNSRLILESACHGLNKKQKRIVEGIYREVLPLMEVELSADQINQLFTDTESTLTASGKNRTLIGKGKDTATKVNDVTNRVGKWLQDTAPVQAFDQKFADLKEKVSQKFPDSKVLAGVEQLGKLAKEHPGKTAAVIGVLTAIVSLTTGPVGGAIAGQILRGVTELMKGERLSTAIGKGAKTAAMGALLGSVVDIVGGSDTDALDTVADSGRQTAIRSIVDVESVDAAQDAAATAVENGSLRIREAGQIYGNNTIRLKAINGEITDWNSLTDALTEIRSSLKNIDPDISPREQQFVMDGVEDYVRRTVAKASGGSFSGSSDDLVARYLELVQGVNESNTINTNESLNPGQIKMLFLQSALAKTLTEADDSVMRRMGKNITTKVTTDKLQKAWKSAGSPTDSDAIAEVLRNSGVDEQTLASVYASAGLQVPAKPETTEPQQPSQSSEPSQQTSKQAPALTADDIIQAIQKMTPDQLQKFSGQQARPIPKMHPDVTTVSSADPIVLRYKNQDYALADDDVTWVKFGTKKAAPPEMSRFLHKQLRAL